MVYYSHKGKTKQHPTPKGRKGNHHENDYRKSC
uniref:Uncharacterized protein n=1 Tax=Siphoviridae sp. ctqED62 TaxID=2826468 RepID=A0A8S5MRK4_9CAUD|nr:MAG TPA: hypothetical protein [Siphoviridae sp. ctqED62]